MPTRKRAKQDSLEAGDTVPGDGQADGAQTYLAYPQALKVLRERLGPVQPEELAMWVFYGPDNGGLRAYMHANELSPPPKFSFQLYGAFDTDGDPSFVAPLMGTWYLQADLDRFTPTNRYIKGAALRERWSVNGDLDVDAFVLSKIEESRLQDAHPIHGLTRGSMPERTDLPPWDSAMFKLADVMEIEATDLGGTALVVRRGETRAETRARLNRRAKELEAAGVRKWNEQLALEEGVSVARIKQLRGPVRSKGKPAGWTGPLDTPIQTRRRR